MGKPTFAIGKGSQAGMEQGPHRVTGQQGIKHRRITAIGQAYPHATGGGDAGGGEFGPHAPGAPTAPIPGHPLKLVNLLGAPHLQNWPCLGIMAGITGIKPVYIGQQHQLLGPDSYRHQRREGVVVAEAQLIGSEGIVFVDNGNH